MKARAMLGRTSGCAFGIRLRIHNQQRTVTVRATDATKQKSMDLEYFTRIRIDLTTPDIITEY